MKQLILSFSLLCGLSLSTARAQLGIQTVNPQGRLHIDGATTPATVNPPSGSVSPEQASDDIVIDANGRIGAGLAAPAAGIDLISDTPGGALRIQDGTESQGNFLFSSSNGTGFWAPLATGSWYAALYDSSPLEYNAAYTVRKLVSYAGSLISPGGEGSIDAAAGTVTLPSQGKYRITVSIYWEYDRGAAPYLTKGVLLAGENPLQTFTYWGGSAGANGVLPSFVCIHDLNAGDVLTLATDETQANYANKARAVLLFVELLL
jgi:hypothetical protein